MQQNGQFCICSSSEVVAQVFSEEDLSCQNLFFGDCHWRMAEQKKIILRCDTDAHFTHDVGRSA